MKTLSIICGVLMCILGGCAMAMPFRTFLGIGWLVGALFLVYGIQIAAKALKKEKKDVWGCIFGVVTALVGIWITVSAFQRVLTDMMIAYLVGFNLVFYAVLRLIAGYKLCKAGEKKGGILAIILGVISLLCGLFAVGHPFLTMMSVGYVIAFNLIVQGVSMITMACVAKKED